MITLFLADGSQLDVTSHRRLFSADRNDWVAAGELREGEQLETRSGTVAAIHVNDSDVAKEVEAVPCAARDSQQRACDKWRQQFNCIRPHDALNDRTPAEVYKSSPCRVRERMALYPSDWIIRKVSRSGHVRIASEHCFLSGPLRGRYVGLQPVDALHWRAWFYEVDLGLIEVAPTELPDKVTAKTSKAPSVPSCSNASSVRARKKRAPAAPRLTRSARASQSRVSKKPPPARRSRSKATKRK